MTRKIDLNCDMGEGFGSYRCADDDAMLEVVSSVNLACGFHAGDPSIMGHVCKVAKEKGIAVGAHPGYPDLWGFGRRHIPFSQEELVHLIAYQVGALDQIARIHGHKVSFIKAHGALGHLVADKPEAADTFLDLVEKMAPGMVVSVMASTLLDQKATARGLPIKREIYADRGYSEDGRLLPRGTEGSVIHEVEAAIENVLAMLDAGAIITTRGNKIETQIDTICIHSDSPSAHEMAPKIRKALLSAGYEITPHPAIS